MKESLIIELTKFQKKLNQCFTISQCVEALEWSGKKLLSPDFKLTPRKQEIVNPEQSVTDQLVLLSFCCEQAVQDKNPQLRLLFDLLKEMAQARIEFLQTAQNEKILSDELTALKNSNALLHSVAHDLRTPLTGIIGMSDLIHHLNPSGETDELALQIKHQANWLHEILENILSLLRLEYQGFQKHLQTEIIQDLIDESLVRLGDRISHLKIETSYPDEFVIGQVDPKLFIQLMVNLVDNAACHSSDGSSVEIRLSHNQDTICIEVIDEGCGIEESNLNRIFEPFFTTRKNAKKKGTGLGLSICKTIVSAHQGTIQARNRKDKTGTIFTVLLPEENLKHNPDISQVPSL